MAFCLWATPTHHQAEYYDRRGVCKAFFSCSATLNDFCTKWQSARVFGDTFDLLVEALPLTEFGDPTQYWSLAQPVIIQLKQFIVQLEELRIQQKVITMLRMMCQGRYPAYSRPAVDETSWIQYEYRDGVSI